MARLVQVVQTIRAGEVRLLVRNGTPLDRMLLAGAVSQGAYLAGRRYAETWEAAGLRPVMTAGWDAPVDGSGDGTALERQSASQARALRVWRKARSAMPAGCRPEVDRVVLWDEEARDREALLVGLAALVRYYVRVRKSA